MSEEARIAALEAELAAARERNAELERLVADRATEPPPAEVLVTDGPVVTCPACGAVAPAPDGNPYFAEKTISRCTRCQARVVYGELAPRVVVEPSTFDTTFGPRPALLLRFQDVVTKTDVHAAKVDPELGFLIAQAMISLIRP